MSSENPESLDRPTCGDLDQLLGVEFPVLDKGFIRVVDYMGDESAIVQAARVSYGKGTKRVSEDRNLIRYLLRHNHLTPFEMCEIKLHIRIPMDAWRQMVRHRTASINEYSTRYSEAIDAMQETPRTGWRLQSSNNKQGSDGFFPESPQPGWSANGFGLSVSERQFHKRARELYKQRLEHGVAREQARKDLPLSCYTEAYWKIDLRNLLGFLSLRMDSHAQKEIRDYATTIGEEIVARWLPNVWEAFNDYHPLRDAFSLTRLDGEIIKSLAAGQPVGACLKAMDFGWLNLNKGKTKLRRNRERSECGEKLRSLGFTPPWKDFNNVQLAYRQRGGDSGTGT